VFSSKFIDFFVNVVQSTRRNPKERPDSPRSTPSRVKGANGLDQILPPDDALARRAKQRRYRQPRPPRIQRVLKRAQELQNRLEATPGLTRDALAREEGIDPSQLTKILHLLSLAPEIQRHILAMPPTLGRGPLTVRSLMLLAKIPDKTVQLQNFCGLSVGPRSV